MNEQTPTWSCPVCYRRIEDWEDLIVDGYFTEMLLNTPKHIDTVRVEPNGHVTIIDENPDLANKNDDSEEEEETEAPLADIIKPEEVTILLDDDDEHPPAIVQNNSTTDETQAVIPSQQTSNDIPFSDALTTGKRKSPCDDHQEPTEQPARQKQKTNIIDLTLDSEDELEEPFIEQEGNNNSTRYINL
jgi:hypothetical protein